MPQSQARRWPKALAALFLGVSLPVLLVVSPLYYFIRPTYVEMQYRRAGFPPSWRFSPEERARLSRPILLYLRGRITAEEMASSRTDAGEVALQPDEVQHLVDVRGVVDWFFLAHKAAIFLALASGVFLWFRKERRAFLRAARYGAGALLVLIVLILLSAWVNFDAFFTRFHQIFFKEGTWIFAEESTLIQLYPLPFWVDTVTRLVLTILVETLAVWALSWWLEGCLKRRGMAND